MTVPTKILELIERFDRNLDAYKEGGYNETQIRREFIDPFFEELGWDIANKQGYAEAYKDVVHEEAIKVGKATKAPDYGFRIGGVRKFFLEAKKPSVNIKEDTHPAYQLRRYAWSAKLPLSILTDFEELAVYDCRSKPVKTDKPSHSRILYMTYTEYAERWGEITNIFSRDAILKGSFDKYAESKKGKRGTAEVDSAFLQEIERWRSLLARNIALRNPDLSQRELNFAVQCTIDRIIFLRICEDRGIEPYGRLMALNSGNDVYKQLFQLFLKADDKYNSGLFHFKKEKGRKDTHDCLTPGLTIDDKTVKDIVNNLYYPDSPYEFSVLPADILGQVYEQFLGKVIRLTSAHRAVVEDKPEVKKAGGVYYTPTYIVDYIVKQTVGKLVEGRKPVPQGSVSKLRILDPACGSGSFLLGAYQFLLNWHLDQYVNDDPNKWAKGRTPRLYRGTGGEWKLTTGERKRILLNNIYGVDIDHQAVEVTKLSLLLKVLEEENEQTIGRQLSLFQERVLPDLQNNIKCGNSLIGPDFYHGKQMALLNEDEMFRINVFDWEKEFPEIMKDGGFDAVIGNPPYVRIQTMQGTELDYYKRSFISAGEGNYDLYVTFIEKGFLLLKEKGVFGMILPHKFFKTIYGRGIRGFISERNAVYRIIDFTTNQIFKDVATYTCLLFLENCIRNSFDYFKLELGTDIERCLLEEDKSIIIRSDKLKEDIWNFHTNDAEKVLEKIGKLPLKLKDVTAKIFKGSSTGNDKVYVLEVIDKDDARIKCFSQILNKPIKLEAKITKPFLFGSDIRRYGSLSSNHILLFPYHFDAGKPQLIPFEQLQIEYPLASNYLLSVKNILTKRRIPMRTKDFYKFSAARSLSEYIEPKILVPDILIGNRVSIDLNGSFFHGPAIHSIVFNKSVSDHCNLYFLGIINSKIFWYFVTQTGTALRGNAYRLTPHYIEPFPLRTIDFTNSTDKFQHDKMVALVDQILDLHKQLATTKLPQQKTVLKRQIENTDRQIDELVYELYNLTEEEIKIVEEGP